MYPVRNSVKALIIRDNKLLCIRKTDKKGFYYLLPGGGQEKNETFIDAVKRECREEIGAEIEVKNLRFIREYIGKNHEFKSTDGSHQVEFMFECALLSEPDITRANHLDADQNGLKWIDLEQGKKFRVYPKVLIDRINNRDTRVYWGDVN